MLQISTILKASSELGLYTKLYSIQDFNLPANPVFPWIPCSCFFPPFPSLSPFLSIPFFSSPLMAPVVHRQRLCIQNEKQANGCDG